MQSLDREEKMKKLINSVDSILEQSLAGFCEAHADIELYAARSSARATAGRRPA